MVLHNDVSPRAARLFFALGMTAALGALSYYLTDGETTGRGIKCATATAGIIIVVAQNPLVGGQPRAVYENTLGTIMGATMGVLMFFFWDRIVPFDVNSDYYLRLLTTPIVGTLGLFIGAQLGMEGAGKLVGMTYLLVVVNNVEEDNAESYAAYRITGIVLGMLLNQLTSTIVFQRSATEDVIDKLRTALDELAELNRLVWGKQRKVALLPEEEAAAAAEGAGSGGGGRMGGGGGGGEEAVLEGFQARINATLNGALATLPQTASELRVVGGPLHSWWFIPWVGYTWGCWRLDRERVVKAVSAIRRVNRLQYSFWLLLSHPPNDASIRDNPTLVQMLKDFRFLTQAVMDGMLSAFNRLTIVDRDALAYLNTKVLESQALVTIGQGSSGSGPGSAASRSPSLMATLPSTSMPGARTMSSRTPPAPPPSTASGTTTPAPAPAAAAAIVNGADLTEPLLPPNGGGDTVVTFDDCAGGEADEDNASMFHHPPLLHMPTVFAAFERSVLSPEVWWHTFQFLLVQLAAEAAAAQGAVEQVVFAIKPSAAATGHQGGRR